jgi:hypothetical protein
MYVTIPRPALIATYNKGMGGVDLYDQFLSFYTYFSKSVENSIFFSFPNSVLFILPSLFIYILIFLQDKDKVSKVVQMDPLPLCGRSHSEHLHPLQDGV